MAAVVTTFFLSTTALGAESGSGRESITATTDESGRKIYVNDGARGAFRERTNDFCAAGARLLEFDGTSLEAGADKRRPDASGTIGRIGSEYISRRAFAKSSASESRVHAAGYRCGHRTGGGAAQCRSQPGALGDQGGIEFQPQRRVSKRRDGADAVDALDRAFAQCFQSL